MFEQGDLPIRLKRPMDGLMTLIVWGSALVVAGAFAWLLVDLLWHGAGRLSWSFLFSAPRNAGRSGGIESILVSTLLILAVTIITAVPLGLATAVLLTEYLTSRSQFRHLVGLSLDVLAGVPSIVFGLFGNAFFCVFLGLGFSILSGGLTLACMVLPIFIRTAEQALRAVRNEWRLGCAALGISRAAALWQVLLPASSSGIVAGLMLGIGRAMAETAALIFTSGYVDRMPSSLFDSGRALSVHIYDLSMNVAGGDNNAYASALVLIVLLLLINGSSLWLAERVLGNRILFT